MGKPDNNNIGVDNVLEEMKKLDPPVKTAEEILKLPDNIDIWAVKDLIPEGCTILAGAPKDYKTYLSIHIANCLATGKKVFGRFEISRERRTLILDRENSPFLIKKRLKQLGVTKKAPIYWRFDSTPIHNKSYKEGLLKTIQKLKVDFLVVDSFRRFHSGDENSSESVAKTFQLISEIKALDVSVLIVHHLRKQSFVGKSPPEQMLRGSSDLIAYPDAILGVKRIVDGSVISLKIEQPAIRVAEGLTPFILDINSDEDSLGFSYKGVSPSNLEKPSIVMGDILEMVEEQTKTSRKEIHDKFKSRYSRRLIDAILKKMKEEGKLIAVLGQRGSHLYQAPTEEDQLLLEPKREDDNTK